MSHDDLLSLLQTSRKNSLCVNNSFAVEAGQGGVGGRRNQKARLVIGRASQFIRNGLPQLDDFGVSVEALEGGVSVLGAGGVAGAAFEVFDLA